MLKEYNINQTTLKILALFRGDYGFSFHLREIARETKVDVKAVQLQLKRLEEMNVISSKLKGRNKECRLNLTNYATKYYMMLAETFASINYLENNFEVKKLVSELGDSLGDAVILFGSFAKREMTEESDIDLLVVGERRPGLDAVLDFGRLIDREISVKFVTKDQFSAGMVKDDPLIGEVVANHVILKGIDDICGIMWRYYAR